MNFAVNAFLAVVLLVAARASSAHVAQNDPNDVAAIREVVEKFRTSIINKDKATFTSLFYSDKPEQVTWQFVVDDPRLARVQKSMPEARKARRVPGVNYLTFIDAITKPGSKPGEEIFTDVRIDTDGEIGSVNFDYSYLAESKETNWGREMWHLVRTESGWKIISVIFSVRDPRTRNGGGI